ncbi:MAG TPA: hypothetical protein PLR99_31885 [Polyangiaceae bacterium]|jgi:hypothetical protein|nr:hypothetical protein [Polyangiaceae bacterium]
MRLVFALLPVLVAATSFAACSDSTPTADAGPPARDGGLGNLPDGYVDPNDPVAQCQSVGGAIVQLSCCKTSSDFPDMCKPGACGCDPADSKETQVCTCPGADICWNGKRCTR